MDGLMGWAAWRSTRNQFQRLHFHWTWSRGAVWLTPRFTVGETDVLKTGGSGEVSLVPLCHLSQVTVQLGPFRTEPTPPPTQLILLCPRLLETTDTQLGFAETRKEFTGRQDSGVLHIKEASVSTQSPVGQPLPPAWWVRGDTAPAPRCPEPHTACRLPPRRLCPRQGQLTLL